MSWLITIVVFLMIIPASFLIQFFLEGLVELLVDNSAKSWKAKFVLATVSIASIDILYLLHQIIEGVLK